MKIENVTSKKIVLVNGNIIDAYMDKIINKPNKDLLEQLKILEKYKQIIIED